MSDLKPCPFCKGEFAFDFEIKKFRCDKCGATVLPDPYGRTVNTRPIEDELRARIAELEEKQRWRVVANGELPEDLQSIIVFTKDRKTYIIRFLGLYGREGFGSLSDIVTRWTPFPELPEPPEVQE